MAGEPRLVGSSAAILVGAFLVILVLLHFLEPEFDPSWRMISEYEIGRYGWLMTIAFFCWGLGALDLQMVLSHSLQTLWGKVGRWWLVVIAVAMMLAGVFRTNAITDNTVSLDNTIHTLCGAIVIMTFPVAASLIARSLLGNARLGAGAGLAGMGHGPLLGEPRGLFRLDRCLGGDQPGRGASGTAGFSGLAEPGDGPRVQRVDDRGRAVCGAAEVSRRGRLAGRPRRRPATSHF